MRPVVLTYLACLFHTVARQVLQPLLPRRLAGAVAHAVTEEPVDAVPGPIHELAEMRLHRDVEVAQENQACRKGLARAVVLVNDDQAGEMDVREGAEVEDRAVGDSVAHRGEQSLEIVDGAGCDGRDDRQRGLVRHRRRRRRVTG